jgi:ribonuclease HI
MIKSLDEESLSELLQILNQSFAVGQVPGAWKTGMVVPIPKPQKPKDLLTSYRPIALLSCLGKTMERVIKNRLEYIVEDRGMLLQSQCGFRKGKSTIDILLQLEHTIRDALSKGNTCLVVYIDLKSAFDTVCGEGLIHKLARSGLRGQLLKWLHNYMHNRKITVTVDGKESPEVSLSAGTPQGAVLSPLLFNLMLSDIPQLDGINLHIYADDITVTCSGPNTANVKDTLQEYIHKFVEWAETWGMIINPAKTVVQHFSRKRIQCPELRMMQSVIGYQKQHRLLGLTFDSPSLVWTAHVKYLKTECTKRIDLLKTLSSVTWGSSAKVLRTFYVGYIRAKLSYGSVIYGSAAESTLKKLDVIQNSCMRFILGARNTTPTLSMQVESHLPPLKLHRGYMAVKQFIKLRSKEADNLTVDTLTIGKNNLDSIMPPPKSFIRRAMEWLTCFDMDMVKRTPLNVQASVPPWLNVQGCLVLDYDETRVTNNGTFCHCMDEAYSGYSFFFTDGSKTNHGGTESAAAAMYFQAEKSLTCWRLRPCNSVISTELFALHRALLYIDSYCPGNCVVFTDSKSSLQLIKTTPKTYVSIVGSIQKLLLELNATRCVILHWVRGHSGIRGNEIADRGANEGHTTDRSTLYDLTDSEYVSILKKKFNYFWDHDWKFTTDLNLKGMFLRGIRDHVGGHHLPQFRSRRTEIVLNRMRMGHVGVNAYLHRFHMDDTGMCPNAGCNLQETIEHYMLHCPSSQLPRTRLRFKLNSRGIREDLTLKLLLSSENPKVLPLTMEYVKATGRMDTL